MKKIKVKIETVRNTTNGKRSNEILESIEEFDEHGRILRRHYFEKGKLVSLSISSYTKNAMGEHGVEQVFNREGKITDTVKSRYNENGEPMLEQFWKNDVLTYQNKYRYNALGNLLGLKHFTYAADSGYTLHAEQKYKYNEKNKLIQEIGQRFDKNNTYKVCLEYEYDARGNKIRRFENGELYAESKFNEKNQETKEIGFSTSKQCRTVCYNTYNKEGNEIKKRFLRFDGKKLTRETILHFRYDDCGNVIETRTQKKYNNRIDVEVKRCVYGYW